MAGPQDGKTSTLDSKPTASAAPAPAESATPKAVAPTSSAPAKAAEPVKPEPAKAPVAAKPAATVPEVRVKRRYTKRSGPKASAPAAKPKAATPAAKSKSSVKPAPTVTIAPPAKPSPRGSAPMATKTFSPTFPSFPIPENMQALFGDFQTRTKASVEKSAKMVEDMGEFAKGNVEALMTSGRIAAKGAETLGQDAAEYSKKSMESATAAFKSFAAAKSPTELFTLQSDYARKSFDSAVADMSKFSETWLKLAGEIVQPLSSRVAVAAEKIKTPLN